MNRSVKRHQVRAEANAVTSVRRDLAAAYNAFAYFGWTDLIYTHLTARAPDDPNCYFIIPYGMLFEEVTPECFLKVHFDGRVVDGDGPYNDAGHAIHSAVLKTRPEINVVMHSHTRAGIAVSAMEAGLMPISQQANEIMGQIAYHDYDVPTENSEECARLGQDLGRSYAMILRNHGLLTVGRTCAEAFYFMYILENACKIQVDALQTSAKLIIPSNESRHKAGKWGTPSITPGWQLEWEAVLRLLSRPPSKHRDSRRRSPKHL